MAAPVRLRELFHVGIDPSLLALKGAQGELFHGQSSQLKSSGIWVAERYQESFKIQSLSLFLFCFSVGCWHTKAPKLPSCRLTGKWESSQGHPAVGRSTKDFRVRWLLSACLPAQCGMVLTSPSIALLHLQLPRTKISTSEMFLLEWLYPRGGSPLTCA